MTFGFLPANGGAKAHEQNYIFLFAPYLTFAALRETKIRTAKFQRFFEYGYKKAIPLNARHSNTLVHSFPLSVAGATRALGICKMISHMKSMAANRRLISAGLKFKKMASPAPINAIAPTYVQNKSPGSRSEPGSLQNQHRGNGQSRKQPTGGRRNIFRKALFSE